MKNNFRLQIFLAMLIAVGLFCMEAHAKNCIHWEKVFAREAIRKIPAGATMIRVSPIQNDTDMKGDAWISDGLQRLLMRYLSLSPHLGVMDEKQTSSLTPERPIRYKVTGLFQHTKNWLRIFIQLLDSKDKLVAQFPVETPYPLHKHFFTGPREVAEGIIEKIGVQKVDSNLLKTIENETVNVRAYENFIKGMQALESYDLNKTEVALVWFQEARREDPHYVGALRGLMEMHGFLSLHHKQNGEGYDRDLQALESVFKVFKKRLKQKKKGETIENRFLQAHVHYVTGLRAIAKDNAAKAALELEKAAQLVPEDAKTVYSLSEAYDKLGKKELAGQFKNHAEEIDPCLKGQ